MQAKRILVTGAGGFIGHHLVKRLKAEGYWVRGVDLKLPEFEPTPADEFLLLDLRQWENCLEATRGVEQVYNLAADMGGIGYITAYLAVVFRNNILINAHMLEASRQNGVQRFLFSSSACVYPRYRQQQAELEPLREEEAYPADPEPGYGWEKLATEELCRYYRQDYGLDTRVVRFHNVYGPLGSYEGGREKAPAALCRKVALAREGDGGRAVRADLPGGGQAAAGAACAGPAAGGARAQQRQSAAAGGAGLGAAGAARAGSGDHLPLDRRPAPPAGPPAGHCVAIALPGPGSQPKNRRPDAATAPR